MVLFTAHVDLMTVPRPLYTRSVLNSISVYEKLFEVADIMSDAFRLFVGHFHILTDIFLLKIMIMNFLCRNNNI